MTTDYSIILGLAIILFVGGLMFMFISKSSGKKCRTRLKVEDYRVKFFSGRESAEARRPEVRIVCRC